MGLEIWENRTEAMSILTALVLTLALYMSYVLLSMTLAQLIARHAVNLAKMEGHKYAHIKGDDGLTTNAFVACVLWGLFYWLTA